MGVRLTIAVLAVAAAAGEARAQPEEPVERYGLVMAGVDLGAIALVAATGREEAGAVGFFSGPFVHFLYDNHRASWWSIAARTIAPVAGGLGAVVVDGCIDELDECDGDVIFAGALVGLGAAMIFDWTVLAKKPRDAGPAALPVARARRGGFELGLAESF